MGRKQTLAPAASSVSFAPFSNAWGCYAIARERTFVRLTGSCPLAVRRADPSMPLITLT